VSSCWDDGHLREGGGRHAARPRPSSAPCCWRVPLPSCYVVAPLLQPHGFEGFVTARVRAASQDLALGHYAHQTEPGLDRGTAVPSNGDEAHPRGHGVRGHLSELFDLVSPFPPEVGHVGEPAADAVMPEIRLGSECGRQSRVLDARVRHREERVNRVDLTRSGASMNWRTTSTFSCDTAYPASPAASRACSC